MSSCGRFLMWRNLGYKRGYSLMIPILLASLSLQWVFSDTAPKTAEIRQDLNAAALSGFPYWAFSCGAEVYLCKIACCSWYLPMEEPVKTAPMRWVLPMNGMMKTSPALRVVPTSTVTRVLPMNTEMESVFPAMKSSPTQSVLSLNGVGDHVSPPPAGEPPWNQPTGWIERGVATLMVSNTICGRNRKSIRVPYTRAHGWIPSGYPEIWPTLDESANQYLLCVLIPGGYDAGVGHLKDVDGAMARVVVVEGMDDPAVREIQEICRLHAIKK